MNPSHPANSARSWRAGQAQRDTAIALTKAYECMKMLILTKAPSPPRVLADAHLSAPAIRFSVAWFFDLLPALSAAVSLLSCALCEHCQ